MICSALNQRKKHLVIAHSQHKWLWKCSPVSRGAASRHEGSRNLLREQSLAKGFPGK